MNFGRVRTATICAALVLAGCFNPPAKDETGETGAASTAGETGATSSPTSTSTTGVGDTTSTTTPPGPTTSDGCPPGGCTSETGETGETGQTEGTTGGTSLLFSPLPIPLTGAGVPATMDIDGDPSHDDLVVTSSTVSLFYYFAGGSLTPADHPAKPAYALAVEDVKPDTRDDVWMAQFGTPARVVLYTNTGGAFTETAVSMPENCTTPLWMTVGRIDGDALMDVAIACKEYSGGVFYAYRDPNTVLNPTVTSGDLGMIVDATAVALADVHGSVEDDLIAINSSPGKFQVYVGNANVTFTSVVNLLTPVATGLAVGHLNADERVDVGTVRADTSLCDLFLGGPEALGAPTEMMCGANPIDIGFADIDGDDQGDVVTLHAGELHIALNRGGGTSFNKVIVVPAPQGALRLALGNYVGTSAIDIAVTSIDTLTIYEQYE